jgi:hypothetical protein
VTRDQCCVLCVVPLSRHTVRATFLQKAVMLKITKDVLASMAMGRVFQGNV